MSNLLSRLWKRYITRNKPQVAIDEYKTVGEIKDFLFDGWTPVLIADGVPDKSNEIFDIQGVEFDSTVPVTYMNDDKFIIGNATLARSGDRLWAKITQTVPRPAVCAQVTLYPSVTGITFERELSGTVDIIKKCKITSISMDTSNADPRIPSIAWRVKK